MYFVDLHVLQKSAHRAVARANGANQLALIVLCYRVINSDGELGGYGGGVARKQWLLEHEKIFKDPHKIITKQCHPRVLLAGIE